MDHRPTNFFEAGKALDLDADVKSSSNEDTLMLAASASSATYTDGKLVDLSTLGPILLNADGTMGRMTDWKELLPIEQKKNSRFIALRNKKRKAKLQQIRDTHGVPVGEGSVVQIGDQALVLMPNGRLVEGSVVSLHGKGLDGLGDILVRRSDAPDTVVGRHANFIYAHASTGNLSSK